MIVTKKMADDAWRAMLSWMPEELTENPPPPTTADEVNGAFRVASKRAHPDAGGDPAAFAAVDRAKHILLEWLKRVEVKTPIQQKEDCTRCEGKGHLMSHRGFRSMRVTCPKCAGSGDANYDHDVSDHFQGR